MQLFEPNLCVAQDKLLQNDEKEKASVYNHYSNM